jgi:hemolysin III
VQHTTFKQLFAKCDHLNPGCTHTWVLQEERANVITHAIGMALSIAALVLLAVHAAEVGTALNIVSCVIYGVTLVLAYTSSTFYHSARKIGVKKVLRIIDHVCIYLLIAGTYTPFTLVPLAGPFGWTLFGIIWGLALAGSIFRCTFTSNKYEWLSTLIYVLMGWVVILIAIGPIVQALPIGCILWLLAGGLLYTAGVFFFLLETKPYCHTIWHFFVLFGSFCHFIAVYNYIAPMVTK